MRNRKEYKGKFLVTVYDDYLSRKKELETDGRADNGFLEVLLEGVGEAFAVLDKLPLPLLERLLSL